MRAIPTHIPISFCVWHADTLRPSTKIHVLAKLTRPEYHVENKTHTQPSAFRIPFCHWNAGTPFPLVPFRQRPRYSLGLGCRRHQEPRAKTNQGKPRWMFVHSTFPIAPESANLALCLVPGTPQVSPPLPASTSTGFLSRRQSTGFLLPFTIAGIHCYPRGEGPGRWQQLRKRASLPLDGELLDRFWCDHPLHICFSNAERRKHPELSRLWTTKSPGR